jgi:REP element-mobilizing transposase RayT
MPPRKKKDEWYSRGYLPHFDCDGAIQSVTFRLADSLPNHVRTGLEEQLRGDPKMELERRRQIEAHLDAGYGACSLADARIAQLVEDALLHFDGARYSLISWVVMPNHVHVVVAPNSGFSLGTIVHSWKSFTANRANRILARTGPFWQAEYFDRYIRDETHLKRVRAYIHENPVKAGLAKEPTAWRWSSASRTNTSAP